MRNLVNVHCIKHVYPDKTEVAVCGLDFTVDAGERVVILGPNGAGKTTLLSHIMGLLTPVEGSVEVMGLKPDKHFNSIRKNIGVMFQNVDEQIIGPTVYDDIAFALRNDKLPKKQIEEAVNLIARNMGIEEILTKIPHYLSGGQKKKVALAGALVMKPKLLILDEPFEGLDPVSKNEMIDYLNRLSHDEGIALIVATHDINIVPKIADTLYVLSGGNIIARGIPSEVFSRTEVLKEARLEPPVLMELFIRLNQNGFSIGIPEDLDDAEQKLKKLINHSKNISKDSRCVV